MRRTRRPFGWFGMAALALALAVPACKSDLQDRMAEGRKGMEASAEQALNELYAERAETVKKAYENRATLEGEGHWQLRFGKKVASDGLAGRAEALAKTHEKSKLAQAFKDAADFLSEQKDYWADPKGELNRYMRYLDQYIERAGDKNAPFVEQARFWKQFLHASHWEKAKSYPEDTQLTSMYRYWKFAFDFPPEKREAFVHYVNRLCREKLWDYCKPLMWEHRPYAMKKPYLDKLIADLKEFRKDYPESAFDDIAKSMIETYMAEQGDMPEFEEYPVLPDAWTDKDAVGGDELVVGPRGITWNGGEIAPVKGDDLALDRGERRAAAEALNEKLSKVIEDMKEQFDDPTIQLAIAQIDRKTPLATVAPLFWVMLENKVTELGLMARRRADGSNRKVGVYLTTYYTPWPPLKDIEERKTKEQREEDEKGRLRHDPRRKVPERIAGMKCRGLGRTGKSMAMHQNPTKYLALTEKRAVFGPIEMPEDLAEDTAEAGNPTERKDAKELLGDDAAMAKWAEDAGEAAILAVHESWTYADLMTAIQKIVVKCGDEACESPEERDLQLTIAICE